MRFNGSQTDRSMHILFVLFSLDAGGVTTANTLLAENMLQQGHRVTFFCFTDNAEKKRVLKEKGIQIYTSPFKKLGVLAFIYNFISIWWFFIRKRHFSGIIIPSFNVAFVTLIALKLSFYKTKTIVNFHTHISRFAESKSAFNKKLLSIGRHVLRLADICANVSKEAALDARDYFKLPVVHVLYNPLLPYTAPQNPPELHRWFQESTLIPLVACGRLAGEKDYPLMLQALKVLNGINPHYRLIILGKGSLEKDLKSLTRELGIEEIVDFIGDVPNARDYMQQARFLWLTSKYEGFGLVLLEALSTGTSCVSVDCQSGPAEILQDGNYGCLVKSRDPEIMATSVIEFTNQPPKPREFYQQRAADFDPSLMTQKYLDLLKI